MGWFGSEDIIINVNVTEHLSAGALVLIALCVVFYLIGKLVAKHMKRTATDAASREVCTEMPDIQKNLYYTEF